MCNNKDYVGKIQDLLDEQNCSLLTAYLSRVIERKITILIREPGITEH
jgi:hypothetical protein